MRKLGALVLLTVTFAGCNCGVDDMGSDAGVDAGVVDAGGSITRDSGVTIDAGIVDAGGLTDAGLTDAGIPDAGIPDASIPDASIPDASIPDASIPDASIPDASIPDASIPDASIPDASVPDASVPDASVPDASVPDASVPDAGVDPDAGCSFGSATSLAVPGMLDLFGQISYFGDGGVLPAGRYRVQYLDGCMKYSSSQDWTIHAYANGANAWWLVGENSGIQYVMPPGTVGYAASNGAYPAFADCVTANHMLPPTDFDFDGGVIGVWLQDSPYSDNMAGENGRNPSWSLTRLGGCGPVE